MGSGARYMPATEEYWRGVSSAEAEKQAAAAMPAKVFEVAPQLNPCAPPPFAVAGAVATEPL